MDGKASINRYLSVEHYPLPRIDDILAKIANWKVFCKIDLTGAYLQVKLSESSQNVCTINTHKGLYKYTRMPFGVQSAPAIFQAIVDQILLNTKGIAYLEGTNFCLMVTNFCLLVFFCYFNILIIAESTTKLEWLYNAKELIQEFCLFHIVLCFIYNNIKKI